MNLICGACQQVLHSMLEKELWKKLPMAQGTVPDLARALEGRSQSVGMLAKPGSSSSLSAVSSAEASSTAGPSSDGFDVYLAQGNPWKATQGKLAFDLAVLCCAELCCAVVCCAELS